MDLVCLDLEGVLLPEIWVNIALKTNIDELKLTTRDISDYGELMKQRIDVLYKKNIKMSDILKVIETISPLEGAVELVNKVRENFQLIILSDTFYQFVMPIMKKINMPTIFCHNLIIDGNGFISSYKLRQSDSKRNAVIRFKELNFRVIASGDSYNDLGMLKEADRGILFCPPDKIKNENHGIPICYKYDELFEEISKPF
jgi:phosphoserine/homoserine phosphotransferase